jgi:hypothetical protein
MHTSIGELAVVACVCAWVTHMWTESEVCDGMVSYCKKKRDEAHAWLILALSEYPPPANGPFESLVVKHVCAWGKITHRWCREKIWCLLVCQTFFLHVPTILCVLVMKHRLIFDSFGGGVYAWLFLTFTADVELRLGRMLANAEILETSTQRAIAAGAKLLEQKVEHPNDFVGPIAVQSRRGGVSIGGPSENFPNWPMNQNQPNRIITRDTVGPNS